MNILVLIKQVPDTEAKIVLSDNQVKEEGIKWVIAPYDEIALEEAIRIREKSEDCNITAISVGLERAASTLRSAYAMGADKAVLIQHDEYEMLDSSTIAHAIIKAVEGESYDIILAGRQATDSDNGQVPLIVATKLGYPLATFVNEINIEGNGAKLTCEVEGGEAIYEASFPLVVTANDRLNEPRYPSLKGIMSSKKKPIETKNIKELGISLDSRIEVVSLNSPPSRPSGRILDGDDAASKAKSLTDALRNEVKVI